jgi:hypothetical protein
MFRRIAEPFIGIAAIIQCRKPVACTAMANIVNDLSTANYWKDN